MHIKTTSINNDVTLYYIIARSVARRPAKFTTFSGPRNDKLSIVMSLNFIVKSLITIYFQWIKFRDRSICAESVARTDTCSSNEPVSSGYHVSDDGKFPVASGGLIMYLYHIADPNRLVVGPGYVMTLAEGRKILALPTIPELLDEKRSSLSHSA